MKSLKSLMEREKKAGPIPRHVVFGFALVLCGAAQIGMIWNTYIIVGYMLITPVWVQWMHDVLLAIGGICAGALGFSKILNAPDGD